MNEACSQPIEGEAAALLIEPLTELVIRAGATMVSDGEPVEVIR